MRSEAEITRAIGEYADTVRRIYLVHLKNQADTEDIFQDVFLKYALHDAPFESPAHEKAWIIRVPSTPARICCAAFSAATPSRWRRLLRKLPPPPKNSAMCCRRCWLCRKSTAR